LSILKKFVEHIQISLISDKYDGYFTRKPYLVQFFLE